MPNKLPSKKAAPCATFEAAQASESSILSIFAGKALTTEVLCAKLTSIDHLKSLPTIGLPFSITSIPLFRIDPPFRVAKKEPEDGGVRNCKIWLSDLLE